MIQVNSEIGNLIKVLIHSPDRGLGLVVPDKAQEWLFEDIVHMRAIREKEYDLYLKVLLYFLDPPLIKGRLQEIDHSDQNRAFYKPQNANFYSSKKVIEFESLLYDVLADPAAGPQLVAAVCAFEGCSWSVQKSILSCSAKQQGVALITGMMPGGKLIFHPVPNLIFTRDLGVVIGDHVLVNRSGVSARSRESLLAKYVFFNHSVFASCKGKIIEVSEDELGFTIPKTETGFHRVALEGGDVMMISPNHLLIGISERTTSLAAQQVMTKVFAHNLVKKVTVLRIPKKRAFMHIDTLFTQVKRDCWVMHAALAGDDDVPASLSYRVTDFQAFDEKLLITQYGEDPFLEPKNFGSLQELLRDISCNEFGVVGNVDFILSGDGAFPFDAREQWTDACNLLTLKEGVAFCYDRNEHTAKAFQRHGFNVIHATELIVQLEQGLASVETIENTLILLPSAELSRARGGSHCLSLPLQRASPNALVN